MMSVKSIRNIILCFSLCIALVIPINVVSAQEMPVHSTNQWTRQSPYESLEKPGIKWSVELGSYVTNLVIDSDGIIYVVSGWGAAKLSAISPAGKLLWQKKVNGGSTDLTLYQDSSLLLLGYATGNEDEAAVLYSFSKKGDLNWENRFPNLGSYYQGGVGVDDDGFITLAGEVDSKSGMTIHLIGVGQDGTTKWRTELNKPFERATSSSPIIVKGNIYITYGKGIVKKVSKSSSRTEFKSGYLAKVNKEGRILWTKSYDGYNFAEPVYTNNTLYVQADDDINLFDLNGTLKKSIVPVKNKASNTLIAPSISDDGTIIFGHRAYSPSGRMLWSFSNFDIRTSVDFPNNMVTIDSKQNILYDYGKVLYSANLKTKKINWKLPLYQKIFSPSTIGRDGTVYIGGETKLFAIGNK